MDHDEFLRRLAQFAEDLEPVLRASFDQLRELSDDRLVGYSLVSTEGLETLGCIAQTRSARMRALATAARLESARWDSSGWDLDLRDDDQPHAVLERLGLYELDDDDVERAIPLVYEACVTALERLVRSGYFQLAGSSGDEVVIFSLTDWEDDDLEIAWATRLNSAEHAAEFARYLRGEPSPLPVLDPFV